MGILFVAILVAGVFALIIAIAVLYSKNRSDAWQHFASQHQLTLRPSTWTEPPLISGFFKTTAVTITLEYRGSGNSRQAYTKATAQFGAQLPLGMKLGKEGFGTSLAKLFGGQDIQIGIPAMDDALRIQGRDPADIARFLSIGRIPATVTAFIGGADEAVISQQGATIVTSGHASKLEQLQYLMERTNHAVRIIEHELRWDPKQAGKHVPTKLRSPPKKRRRSPQVDDKPVESAAGAGEASAADALIAGLAADGVQESEGKFSLDRDVARKKMREFQLKDPAGYVLELVQAAVIKGASKLTFDIDSDDMRLEFDGDLFTTQDFDQLYGSLFTSRTDANTRARRRLAIGLNAAVGTEPKLIEVTSCGADAGVRLVLTPGEEDRIETLEPDQGDYEQGNRIHVKSRLRHRLGGRNAEVRKQLETCSRYADPEIILNDERISGGATLVHAYGVTPLRGDGLSGQCGFTDRLGDRAEVRMVTDGVWISSYKLPDAMPGLLAVVESSRLKKDLSQSEIVRDDAWVDAIDAVYEAEARAVDALAAQLVQLLPNRGFPGLWALKLLRTRCRAYSSLKDFQPDGAGAQLAKAPLWPTVAGTLASLRTLVSDCAKNGRVGYADYSLEALHLDAHWLSQAGFAGHKVLLISWRTDPRDAAFLVQLFGKQLRSADDELLRYLG